jgi:hypothetical protein
VRLLPSRKHVDSVGEQVILKRSVRIWGKGVSLPQSVVPIELKVNAPPGVSAEVPARQAGQKVPSGLAV